MAIWIPWAKVLVCGDYLSPVEIPTPEASIEAYLATLARLEPLVAAAEFVVPGHGGPIDSATAQAVLHEDRAYLEALREGRARAGALPPRTPRRRAAPPARRERGTSQRSGRPMKTSRPDSSPCALLEALNPSDS